MNSAKLKGKVIKTVHQVRIPKALSNTGRGEWAIESIEFTDGTVLRFIVLELSTKTYALAGMLPGKKA